MARKNKYLTQKISCTKKNCGGLKKKKKPRRHKWKICGPPTSKKKNNTSLFPYAKVSDSLNHKL